MPPPNMCIICCKHENRSLLIKSPLIKKWHNRGLSCTIYVVIITIGLSYGNISLFKKWHLLDLVCSAHVVTIATLFSYSNRCPKKVAFSKPNMCNVCCYHENRSFLVKSPLLKKWHHLDLVYSIYVGTMTTGLSCSR